MKIYRKLLRKLLSHWGNRVPAKATKLLKVFKLKDFCFHSEGGKQRVETEN